MDDIAAYPQQAEDAFNRRNLDGLGALWAPDVHYVSPDGESVGREASLARERRLFAACSDIRADLRRHHRTADGLVIEGVLTGTHDGALQLAGRSVPPTGRRLEIRFAAVFGFVDGRVAEERVYYDRVGLLAQLGLVG